MTTLLRRAAAAATLLASGLAFAHPGHDAPTVHAHDFGEAIAMAAVIVVIALVGARLAAVRRAKARTKRRR